MSVIWHDLECGAYSEDIGLWRSLAAERAGAVLDLGAGTGRVTLELARAGHRVTALDHDPALLAELQRRAAGLDVQTVLADAREFELRRTFALCIMPMQTMQLLGGSDGRIASLRCIARHLQDDGLAAITLSEELQCYEVLDQALAPLPDIAEIDGVVFSSQPTAIRAEDEQFVLVRKRETVDARGLRSVAENLIQLDRLTPTRLEQEAEIAGMRRSARAEIPPTPDYVGSTVVMLSG